MALSSNQIKNFNREFYSRSDAVLFSGTYSMPLSWVLRTLNTTGSLLYVASSTAAALCVKEICRVYAFIKQAGQTDLAGVEVLSWARSQADERRLDYFMLGILLLGAALMITQVVTKLCIKKYIVYKLERRILWITLALTFLQWELARCGSLHPFIPSFQAFLSIDMEVAVLSIIVFLVLFIVFLMGLTAAKLPYPLEFKQYESLERVLKFTNRLANILQKFILR